MLRDIQDQYSDVILHEACRRFGFDPQGLEEFEGSAFVYGGLADGKERILKITPGVIGMGQVMGSTEEQVMGEIDFSNYLSRNGVPLAAPVASKNGVWVEIIPLNEQGCFLATCFEKATGFMYPDEDEVTFPEEVLVEWGRLAGMMHRLSGGYKPSKPEWQRVDWRDDDLLDFEALLSADLHLIRQRRDELMARLNSLPQTPDVYGLVHADFHHGNFFVDGGRLTVFDFDAARPFWYMGDIGIALYNCLPLPRTRTVDRRTYALRFLAQFLKGYRKEKELDVFWLEQIPLFFKYCELEHYAYFFKYWDFNNLSERRRNLLADFQQRIENEVPVVMFEPGDLSAL
ncbi:MAG TPA: phosphotransferase [Anaerolineaceae bacterium]|nr:phosphotransferase [Anaerolineaceae bacterium]HPN54131.1 phosphotransferase [Anaerolineaceae bacterium]